MLNTLRKYRTVEPIGPVVIINPSSLRYIRGAHIDMCTCSHTHKGFGGNTDERKQEFKWTLPKEVETEPYSGIKPF